MIDDFELLLDVELFYAAISLPAGAVFGMLIGWLGHWKLKK